MTTTGALLLSENRSRLAELLLAGRNEPHDASERSKRLNHLSGCLLYLGEAIANDSPMLFTHFIGWSKSTLVAQGSSINLAAELDYMIQALRRHLPVVLAGAATRMLILAREQLDFMPSEPPSRTAWPKTILTPCWPATAFGPAN